MSPRRALGWGLTLTLVSCYSAPSGLHVACDRGGVCPGTLQCVLEVCCAPGTAGDCPPLDAGIDGGGDAGQSDAAQPDAGVPDAGPADAGPRDAGVTASDGGQTCTRLAIDYAGSAPETVREMSAGPNFVYLISQTNVYSWALDNGAPDASTGLKTVTLGPQLTALELDAQSGTLYVGAVGALFACGTIPCSKPTDFTAVGQGLFDGGTVRGLCDNGAGTSFAVGDEDAGLFWVSLVDGGAVGFTRVPFPGKAKSCAFDSRNLEWNVGISADGGPAIIRPDAGATFSTLWSSAGPDAVVSIWSELGYGLAGTSQGEALALGGSGNLTWVPTVDAGGRVIQLFGRASAGRAEALVATSNQLELYFVTGQPGATNWSVVVQGGFDAGFPPLAVTKLQNGYLVAFPQGISAISDLFWAHCP